MLSLSTLALAGLAAVTQASPVEVARQATPTVYLAGDSTMARTTGAHMGEQWPISKPLEMKHHG